MAGQAAASILLLTFPMQSKALESSVKLSKGGKQSCGVPGGWLAEKGVACLFYFLIV